MKQTEYSAHLRYSDRAQNYRDFRPSYPIELIDLIRQYGRLSQDSPVAELGSGTGIFTRMLLGAGWMVHAVEPNAEMRVVCARDLGHEPLLRCVAASAEATTLPSASCRAIVAAQSFHWFDQAKAADEVLRVLAPDGIIAIIWNELDRSCDDLHTGLHALTLKCPDYSAHSLARFDTFESQVASLFSELKVTSFALINYQRLNLQGLQGRMASSSHWPAPSSALASEHYSEISRLFAKQQDAGFVTLRYETKILMFARP